MSTPAGWYDDGNGQTRWWDGTQWTEHFAPTDGGSQSATPPLPPPTGGTMPVPGGVATVPPPAMAPSPSKKAGGLAIAALIVSIVAFLTGLVPVLGAILGIIGILLGIFALVRKQSKGLGVTAIVLGAIALISSVAVTAGLGAAVNNIDTSAPRPAVEVEVPDEDAAGAPEEVDSTVEDDAIDEAENSDDSAAPAPEAGTVENPLPQPYIAKGLFGGEKYSLVGHVVSSSANADVEDWNMFNSEAPAGYKYVVVELTMTGIDPDGVEPSLAAWDLYLATAEGNRYDSEFIVFGDGMPSMQDGPKLYPGNAFTGYTAYIVPESAESFLLYDNRNYIAIG